MGTTNVGFFGKLPSHGDFIRRSIPETFVNPWDLWLQRCMLETQERLSGDWLKIYLTSPVWRFVLCDGVIGAATFAGILVPSVDSVGRYFPLTIAAELPASLPPMALTIQARQWFRTVETLALDALEAESFDLEEFDAALRASGNELQRVEEHVFVTLDAAFPQPDQHWRLPLQSSERVAAALIDPLMAPVARSMRPMSLWWSEGSEHVAPSCLVVRKLPDPLCFTAMLDGRWQAAGWSGELADPLPEAETLPSFPYRLNSAAATDAGPSRTQNQDNFLDRVDLAMWAVADGVGGLSHGERASRMVVDVLASLEPVATLGSALGLAMTGLERVNEDLCRAAQNSEDKVSSGSTVVVLSIQQHEWGVLWAGDSRVYLLRDGSLNALTRDHSAGELAEQPGAINDTPSEGPPPSTGVITRAVGAEATLMLDQVSGEIQAGDRFLLCSDGLHGALPHETLTEILVENPDPGAAVEKLLAAATLVPAKDNITAVVVAVVAPEVQ
jgi:type VI secretion system protein ImpM